MVLKTTIVAFESILTKQDRASRTMQALVEINITDHPYANSGLPLLWGYTTSITT